MGLLFCACRSEPGPSLQLSDLPPPPLPSADDPSADSEADAARDLWFSAGPGRRAILARERQDHGQAIVELDRLLASDAIDVNERGAAQLLRGIEDERLAFYASAAQRFAEAAKAPALRPLAVRLAWLEAQARLDAGEPQRARQRLEGLPAAAVAESPLQGDVAIALADALLRTDAPGVAEAYQGYLDRFPDGRRRFEVQAKLARYLGKQTGEAGRVRAVALYESLLLESPLSDYADEAAKALPELRAGLGSAHSGADVRAFERKLALARIDGALERRRFGDVVEEAGRLLGGDAKLTPLERCRVLYAQGSAVFRQRKRSDARPIFERASQACDAAGDAALDLAVKSRYQAARGLYAEGHHRRAALAFEALGHEHASHSYCDDAWVLAGESWESHGDAAKATAAYRKVVDLAGDQQDEGRRRLLLQLFAAGDAEGALALCDATLASGLRDPAVEAKFHYFRGRALQRLGRAADAQKAWVAAIEADPLGYSALQAMSRLRESSALPAGLAALQPSEAARKGHAAEAATRIPAAGERAVLLARLGLGAEARQELEFAKIGGWPAAEVLDQAGLYAEGQRLLANLGAGWRKEPPWDANRKHWEIAYPRPFEPLVGTKERKLHVPELLAYAVMQTESRFDPAVTSLAGARGLIQLMPATAKQVADSAGLSIRPEQLYDPETNLEIGLRYLSGLVNQYGGGDAAVPLAVPSYNAGPGAVQRWLRARAGWELDLFIEAIPYDETRHYTQSVLGRWWAYRWLYGGGEEAIPRLPLELAG